MLRSSFRIKKLSHLLPMTRSISTIVPVSDLRPGNFIKIKNEFCVVDGQRRIAFGRATGYLMLEYHSYLSQDKTFKLRMGLNDSIEKIDPDRIDATFCYCDISREVIILNDAEYNEVEVPLSLFPKGFQSVVQPGNHVTVYKHEDVWLSSSLNSAILSKIRKAQNL